MPQPSPAVLRIIRTIDGFTERTGQAIAWLTLVPLVFSVTFEIVSHKIFDQPTLWAFDMTYMLYGAMFMLGAAFTLLRGGHIRTDMLWERFSERKKGIIDTIAYLFFFFPGILMFFITTVDDAWYAFQLNERSEQTAWRPILWPLKAVVPVTCLWLLVQGVSEFLKSLHLARTGERIARAEKIEV